MTAPISARLRRALDLSREIAELDNASGKIVTAWEHGGLRYSAFETQAWNEVNDRRNALRKELRELTADDAWSPAPGSEGSFTPFHAPDISDVDPGYPDHPVGL
jgi:hypothetical protein